MKGQLLPATLFPICLAACLAQATEPPKQGPVQAEFLTHFNVRHLAPGATVFARVTLDWNGSDCVLRQGSILEARVELAEPHKYRHNSQLALSFVRAQCNGAEMQPLNLMLAAVADAPANWAIVPDSQVRMPISFSNPHGNGMLAGIGSAAAGDLYSTHLELTGIMHRFPMRPDLQPGAVLGLKGMKLDLGTGPNRSSILSSRSGDVSLGAFTQILLVPISLAFRPAGAFLTDRAGDPAGAGTVARPLALPAPANTLDVCAPPGCAVDLPVAIHELERHSGASIALQSLGYSKRSNRVQDTFDDEEALAWLGSNELLFTFNPHRLIRRSNASSTGAPARIIRAVRLSSDTRKVLGAVDWQITDSHRYLWPLDGGRVLAHIGNELRVYGSGLEMERSIPLAGPLAFVRVAPNGTLAAIGTLHERHSPGLHARLREQMGRDPEEDVVVELLDKDFNVIARASTTSGVLPPTLLNEGQVKLLAQPNQRYRLAMSTWEDATTTLAVFDSNCTPELASMAPDLLFLSSCNVMDSAVEYRVLRADGRMLLRGKAGPQQVGHEAAGNSGSATFAVKVIHADRELSPGAAFKGSELDSEEIRIYEAGSGKRLMAVHVDDPPTSRGSYALSPDGSQLAVLSGTEIRFFPVPAK